MNYIFDNKQNQKENKDILNYLTDQDYSTYNNTTLSKDIKTYSFEQLSYLSQISIKCEKFIECIYAFETIYSKFPNAQVAYGDLRNVEVALKSFVSIKQKKLLKLEDLKEYSEKQIDNLNDKEDHSLLLKALSVEKKRIKKEMRNFAIRILRLIDNFFFKNISEKNKGINRKSEVMLLRLKSDCNKYISQIEEGDNERENEIANAKKYYNESYRLAKSYLKVSDEEYMKTVLAYCKFLVYFNNEKEQAKNIINAFITQREIISLKTSTDANNIIQITIINELEQINKELNAK